MRHLIRRILFYLIAVWASVTLNFFIPRLAPGNPVQTFLGQLERRGSRVTPEMREALSTMFGLNTNDPIWLQYFKYLNQVLHGDLGVSLTYFPVSVGQVIGKDVAWTLGLGLIAVIISAVLGCLVGIVMAWKRGSALDGILAPLMNFISAIPYFWMALLILYIFGFILRWFPTDHGYDILTYVQPEASVEFFMDVLHHGILPAATIVIASIAGWMLVMRNSMITTLNEDYVLMAKAKGLTSRRVMFAYAARNAILPNITNFALSIGFIVGGQLLTEMVFSYPGVGYSLLKAVQGQDYSLMQGIFLMIALAVLAANFLADLFYTILDPRVRLEKGE
jgi:peptide/nickel transport system permease protein